MAKPKLQQSVADIDIKISKKQAVRGETLCEGKPCARGNPNYR
jgi:hypothetical protein